MQNLKILTLFGLLHLSIGLTLSTDLSFNSSSSDDKRWLVLDRYEGDWIAFGDSFSAGPGAGTQITGRPCFQSEGAYPPQLQNDFPAAPNQLPHPLKFISCSGAKIPDAIASQLSEITPTNMNYATLSIGSNDIYFAKILQSCIGGFIWADNCEALKAQARNKIYSNDLFQEYRSLVTGAIQRSGWLSRPEPKRPLIFQTAYPTFFDSNTELCSTESFNFLTALGPSMTTELRESMNLLGSELNVMLAHWISYINAEYDPTGRQSAIVFVDQDGDYNLHRFCGKGKAPFDNATTWFFPMRGGNPNHDETLYAGINTATCEAEAGDHTEKLYTCAVAKSLQSDTNTDLTRFVPFTWIPKIFHPTVQGHKTTQLAVKRRMEFSQSSSIRQRIRILATGDSITYGSQQADTSGGYRGYLDTLLRSAIFADDIGQFVPPKWVGTQENGPPGLNLFHEGYSGIEISQLLSKLIDLPSLYRNPNVVLLLIGTNDIYRGKALSEMKDNLKAMLQNIVRITENRALILVGGLIPMGDTQPNLFPLNALQKQVHNYNAFAKTLVNQWKTEGTNMAYVHPSTDQNARRDNLHPNPVGFEKMGHAWFEAIVDAHKLGMIPPVQNWEYNQGNTPATACPVKPTWLEKGLVHNGKGSDIGPEVLCSNRVPPVGTDGGCTCTDGQSPSYYIPRQNDNNCSDHNYRNIHSVHLADLDGDGKADYIHVSVAGVIRADRNTAVGNAVGTWADAGVIYTAAPGVVRRHEVRFADINGDGRADMLWVNSDGSVRGFWNKGALPGDNPAKVQFHDAGMIAGFSGGRGPPGSRVTFADIDGDGLADYIWLEDDGGGVFYLNTGPIPGSNPIGITVGWVRQTQTATGVNGQGTRWRTRFQDLNGDGRADFLWMKPDGSTDLWNNGPAVPGGTVGMRYWYEMGMVAAGVGTPKKVAFDIMFADLDGNGKDDYVYVNPNTGQVMVWLNACIQ